MDRGPDPVGVVRRVRELGFESVLGNHDDKHIRWRRHERIRASSGRSNPMRADPVFCRQNQELSEDDVLWLQSLPSTLDLGGNWITVHAGFEDVPMSEQKADRMARVRYVDEVTGEMVPLGRDCSQPRGTVFWTQKWKGSSNVIYGHAVHDLLTPRIDISPSGVLCASIDTGCCFGGTLTAMVFDGNMNVYSFVQVRAKRAYAQLPPGFEYLRTIMNNTAVHDQAAYPSI